MEGKRDLQPLIYPPMAMIARAGPLQSQEPETSYRVSHVGAGTQVLGLSVVLSRSISRSLVRNGAART